MLPFSYYFLGSVTSRLLIVFKFSKFSISVGARQLIYHQGRDFASQRHYAPFSLISPSVGSHCRILHWYRLSIHPPECVTLPSALTFSMILLFSPLYPVSARVLNCAVIAQHCHQHVFIHDIRSWAVISRKENSPELCSGSCNGSSHCNAFLSPKKMLHFEESISQFVAVVITELMVLHY